MADERSKNTIKKRVISGLIIFALIIVFGLVGSIYLGVVLCVLSCVGYVEFTKATSVREKKDKTCFLEITGVVTIVLYYVAIMIKDSILPWSETVTKWAGETVGAFNNYTTVILFIIIVGFLFMLFAYIGKFPRYTYNQVSDAFFGIIYVGVMLSFIYFLRQLPGGHGMFMYALIFICSNGCDVMAYLFGMLFGKHKLSPILSPKKSIEGAVGGTLSASAAGVVTGVIYCMVYDKSWYYALMFGVICFAGAIVSQCGDLTASAIKRNSEIKDYGNSIPGHGGVLDRFDSVIFVAPVIYSLAIILLRIKG